MIKKCKTFLNCYNEVCLYIFIFLFSLFKGFMCLYLYAILIDISFSLFHYMSCLCESMKGQFLFAKIKFYQFSKQQNTKTKLVCPQEKLDK